MRRRRFGAAGVEVPIIGQGTWQLIDKGRAESALRVGLDLGLTHIDTAELYTGSEEVVGRAVQGRRDQAFLVSKVLPKNASRKGVVEHCRRSLARLGISQLDVHLLHWLEDHHPLDESMAGLGDAIDQGLTRFVGVSNFDVDELERARSLLGRHQVVCDQVYYSPEQRSVEDRLLPYCQKHNVALVAYSPFGSGRFPPPQSERGRTLAKIAARHQASPHQVALNFVARSEGVFVIPKAEQEAHVKENAASLGFALDADDLAAIDAAFPPPKPGTALAVI